MTGHSNFVASVCCLPPDDKYPHGLIFTGSNDSTILAFTVESPQPIFKLTGHSGTGNLVCNGEFLQTFFHTVFFYKKIYVFSFLVAYFVALSKVYTFFSVCNCVIHV